MRLLAVIIGIMALIPPAVFAETASQQYFIQKTPAQNAAEELLALRTKVQESPKDANLHAEYADALRKRGRIHEAAQEYATATTINPELFVSYHQLAVISDDPSQIDGAIARLTKLKMEKPKELMLRVALSELLEKQKNYYLAARVLIEITYDNAVPPKWSGRVNGRIHYLLSKQKEAQTMARETIPLDEDLDVVPAPLPETGLRKGLTASKINESKELKGMGRVPLLP